MSLESMVTKNLLPGLVHLLTIPLDEFLSPRLHLEEIQGRVRRFNLCKRGYATERKGSTNYGSIATVVSQLVGNYSAR